MTGPIRDTTGERWFDVFVESPTRANKTALEVVGVSGSGGGTSAINPYAAPETTTNTTSSFLGNVQTIEYRNGATLLKTVTITYNGCNFTAAIT